jgi:hypothetical protein
LSTVVGDVSVSVGLSEEDLLRGAQRINQTLTDLSKRFDALGQVVDKAMGQAETSTTEAAGATRRFGEEQKKAAQGAKEYSSGLNDLQNVMGKVTLAAGAVAAAVALIAKESVDAYKEQQAAFKGLESVAEKTIGSFGGAKAAVQSLTKDGLLNLAEASKAVQAGLATGFNLEETLNIINAFKDSAAFNRQAGLEFGESVVRAMEGVRMGNSILSDSAGITKNLSMILKEAGKSEQDLQRVTSDASVRRALYNGLLREGALFAGNAAQAADTLAGAQSRQETTTKQAAAAMGESLAPVLQTFSELATSVIGRIAEWIKQNPELARTILLVAAGITTAVAAVGSLTVAVLALRTAINPISGLTAAAVVGITALGGALVAGTVAAAANTREQDRNRTTTLQLMKQYEALRKVIDEGTLSAEEKERAEAKLKDTLEALFELQPRMRNWFDDQGRLLAKAKQDWTEYGDIIERAEQRITQATINQMERKLSEKTQERDNKERDLRNGPGYANDQFALSIENMPESDRPGALAVLAEARAALNDRIATETAELNDEITILEANLDKQKAYLKQIDQPMDPKTALGPKPGDVFSGGGSDPDKEAAKAFASALKLLSLNEQLAQANDKPLTPEQVSESLKKIRTQFADYLKAHPEEALALDVEIAQSDQQTRQAAAKALKDKLAAQKEAMRQNESLLGDHYLQFGKRKDLEEALGTAQLLQRSGDKDALGEIIELSVALRDLDNTLQKAGFEKRFKQIGEAREDALAGMAGTLHQIELDLIDAEGDPAKTQALKERQIALSRQVLEAQQKSLETLLQDETMTADQREQVERELTSVKGDLYDLDTQAHRLATEAKTAAERQAAEEKQKLIQQEGDWLRDLADADLRQMRSRHTEEQRAAQARIKGLQDQLSAMERIWAAEDRRKKQDDLKTQIANIKGQLTHTKVDANGNLVRTYDEAAVAELEKQLAEEQTQDAREQQRQALQEQINAAQASLQAMQESHQREEEARATFWTNLQKLDLKGYADLTEAAKQGLGPWVTALSTKFGEAVAEAQTKATEIANAIATVNTALAGLSGFTAPTLPASLPGSVGGGSSVTIGSLTIPVTLPNVTNPAQFAQQIPQTAGSITGGFLSTGKLYQRTKQV